MQTQYFIKRIEGLIASNELGLAISLLRKFTKYGFEQQYRQILKLSAVQRQFLDISHKSEITLTERMRYKHATTQALLEILASLENALPLRLPSQLAELALHLLHALANRPPQAQISFQENQTQSRSTAPANILEAIPAAKPIRLSIANMLALVLLFIMIGAMTPGFFLLKQHFQTQVFAPMNADMSQEELAELAAAYELTDIGAPNHHLNFDQSIISYWYGRMVEGLDAGKVEKAFAAFNEVITEAQNQHREILTHEDLYTLAGNGRQFAVGSLQ